MSLKHDSAEKHVTGEAAYIDDLPVRGGLLIGKVVYSSHAHARILSFDIDEAKKVSGVHVVLSAKDIPGDNQMGPVVKDEPCLADGEVTFIGQAIFLIAAETEEQCREAENRIKIEYEILPAILSIESAMENNALLGPPRTMERGDASSALKTAPHVIRGELRTGAQEHWYLETQVCLCVPGEADEIIAYSSTQHPAETQALIAEVLGIKRNDVVVEVRRIGGAFGGKETEGNHTACWAALLSRATRSAVKIRLFRDDDMIMTGKRHRYLTRYDAGFDAEGNIQAVKFEFNSDGGAATDLSFAILERTMLHADNAYYVPHVSILARVWKTNLPSNGAFRGFGGPQAIAAMETIIDRIARFLGRDALEIRHKNFYGIDDRNITHYGQKVEHNRLYTIYDRIVKSSDYHRRRDAVTKFNLTNEFLKRGIALTPVKFGISFTTTFLNQAGALVMVYLDGTVLVNHGGIEMGQGLNSKMQSIAALEFGIDPSTVKVNATNTSKVPNTSATAASSGADMNGMAVRNAVHIIKEQVATGMAQHFNEKNADALTAKENIVFAGNKIFDAKHPERSMSFADAMVQMNIHRISLSASGFYATPNVGWDKIKGWGKPFYYYAFGMAVTEVEVDLLTGQHTILRADILHDAGDSLNPPIDIGQIEGGYVQGLGWCTTEEIRWDAKGNLLTHSPDTYKIPSVRDIPRDFRVELLEDAPQPGTIRNSKAVGEPPLMLALSGWLAIKDALSAIQNHKVEPEFAIPATNELIVMSADKLRYAKSE